MAIVKYRSPTPAEREVLFAWLKRASSWTAWKLLLDKHKVFSSAVERAFKDGQVHPRPDGSQFVYDSWMSRVYRCEAAFEAALERLRNGDRRCFLFLGAKGHFSEGIADVQWWAEGDGREQYMGGPEFPPNKSPFWPEIKKAIDDFLDAVSDIAAVLQTRHTDVPATVDSLETFPPDGWAILAARVPREPARARVPAPPEPAVYVKTHRTVPVYGLWEPVESKGGPIDGLMNYLHGGQPAPTIAFANDGPRGEGRPTWWRLLWVDDRYGAKPIPDEERDYQLGTL